MMAWPTQRDSAQPVFPIRSARHRRQTSSVALGWPTSSRPTRRAGGPPPRRPNSITRGYVWGLDRKRGKGGQQVVCVEHVHVHPGGQAIVGSVETGGRGGGSAHEMLEEPHTRGQLAIHLFLAQSCPRCGARTRSGRPRQGPTNGCCRMHGGSSTGPKTAEGWRIRAARTIHGRYSAENRQVAAMIRVLKAEAKRLVELT